jgi:threonine aldolase
MKIIDLRSDTVTKPTSGMLEAMMQARVGDDVFMEDPDTLELEEMAAEMFGREAALFCPSGTMTNQIAIKLHTRPGDEVICDRLSHVYNFEGGGIGFHSGSSVRTLTGDRGRFTAADVEDNINDREDVHKPWTSLVVVENTSNKGGGALWDWQELEKIRTVCDANELKYHIDGARLFNAIVGQQQDPKDYGHLFDTLSVCLSKGLGAPVGSLLIGSKADIKKARRLRKVMGGGMRQSGFLAAAAKYALNHHVDRMQDDHLRARQLGEALEGLEMIENVLPVESNIVIFKLRQDLDVAAVLNELLNSGIKAVPFGPGTIRMVTHLQIDDEMIQKTIQVLGEVNASHRQ